MTLGPRSAQPWPTNGPTSATATCGCWPWAGICCWCSTRIRFSGGCGGLCATTRNAWPTRPRPAHRAHDYAEELLRWARLCPAASPARAFAAVGLWESASQLSRRIAMLLDETFRVKPRGSRRWQYTAAGILLLLGTALSLLTLQPASSPAQPASPPPSAAPAVARPLTADASSDAAAMLKKGKAILEKGDFDAALSAFNEAIRLDPKGARRSSGALAYARLGKHDKAVADCSRVRLPGSEGRGDVFRRSSADRRRRRPDYRRPDRGHPTKSRVVRGVLRSRRGLLPRRRHGQSHGRLHGGHPARSAGGQTIPREGNCLCLSWSRSKGDCRLHRGHPARSPRLSPLQQPKLPILEDG